MTENEQSADGTEQTDKSTADFEGTGLGETIQELIDEIEYFTLDRGGLTLHAVDKVDGDNVMCAFCDEERHINGMRVIQTYQAREEVKSRDFERVCEECITTAEPNPDQSTQSETDRSVGSDNE